MRAASSSPLPLPAAASLAALSASSSCGLAAIPTSLFHCSAISDGRIDSIRWYSFLITTNGRTFSLPPVSSSTSVCDHIALNFRFAFCSVASTVSTRVLVVCISRSRDMMRFPMVAHSVIRWMTNSCAAQVMLPVLRFFFNGGCSQVIQVSTMASLVWRCRRVLCRKMAFTKHRKNARSSRMSLARPCKTLANLTKDTARDGP
mmetsp:Transcript_14651/g.40462  ORF Transcript_14651/g.40462 Transcript_14651/m.40462 type:complete len:203 (+) Transcript_14651:288-896(+)